MTVGRAGIAYKREQMADSSVGKLVMPGNLNMQKWTRDVVGLLVL